MSHDKAPAAGTSVIMHMVGVGEQLRARWVSQPYLLGRFGSIRYDRARTAITLRHSSVKIVPHSQHLEPRSNRPIVRCEQ